MSNITVGIIDDHTLFRKGLLQLFTQNKEFTVILEAEDGFDLLLKLEDVESLPDVLLCDLQMPRLSGLETLLKLREAYPLVKTIMLSMYDEMPIITKCLQQGARGYLLKNDEPEILFSAIQQVYKTGYYINTQLSQSLIKNLQNKPKSISSFSAFNPKSLKPTEYEVLGYICQGMTNVEIAKKVYRSSRTIEGHRQKLIKKSGAKNTASLVAWAFRKGVVE